MSGAPAAAIAPTIASAGILPEVSPEDVKRLEGAVALVASRGGDAAALARAAAVPVKVTQRAMDDPVIAAILIDAQHTAEDDGRLLKPVAARLTLAMLQKLTEAVEAGELDVDDIGNLLPKVHKVVEHSDLMAAGRGNGYDNLPTFHITFIHGGIQVQHAPEPDVIEIIATEVEQ